MFQRIETGLTRIAAALAFVGGLGLIFATLVTCASILAKLGGRITQAVFGAVPEEFRWLRPILGEEELVTYGVGFALFAALPWVMIRKGHIRVDLLERAFGRVINRVLDFLGDLSLAFIAYLILTRQWFQIFRPARRSEDSFWAELMRGNWEELGSRLRDSQESQILGIKLWPTYAVAEFCVAVFFVVACFCVIRSARGILARGALA